MNDRRLIVYFLPIQAISADMPAVLRCGAGRGVEDMKYE